MATSIAASRAALVPSSSSWTQDGGALKVLPRSTFFGSGICCGSSSSKSSLARRASASADLVLNGLANAEDGKAEEKPAAAEAKSFISDVSSLLKLVDSKDIVELEVKHKDYEITIRKAEALQPPASPATPVPPPMPHMFPAFPPYPAFSSPPQAAAAAAAQPSAAAAPSPSPAAPPAPITPAHPPMLSPMAGTFYRSPGPGEPPFVKVGDRVRKGQVICIIEAMKLMNTIECDQDGTVQDILAEDGKPVSVDMPLFVIKP